jgi:hypothetical protein
MPDFLLMSGQNREKGCFIAFLPRTAHSLIPFEVTSETLAIGLIHSGLIRHGRNGVLIDMVFEKRICWERIDMGNM